MVWWDRRSVLTGFPAGLTLPMRPRSIRPARSVWNTGSTANPRNRTAILRWWTIPTVSRILPAGAWKARPRMGRWNLGSELAVAFQPSPLLQAFWIVIGIMLLVCLREHRFRFRSEGTTANGTVEFGFGVGSGFPAVATASSVLDSHWHHVAGVFTGTQIQIYLDGILNGSVAQSSPPVNNSRDVEIGSSYGGGARKRYFNGLIDELRYYNRALSSNEVATIYQAGSAGICFTNNPAPVFVQQPPTNVSVYPGGYVALNAAAMGSPRPTYQWLFNGAPLTNQTAASLLITPFNTNMAGTYTVIASNAFGQAVGQSAAVSVALDYPMVLFREGFEGPVLNSMISTQSVGTFNSPPGVQTYGGLDGNRAFGFGLSTCPASCFGNYTSSLLIQFPAPVFVSYIFFSEREEYDNWGSEGQTYVNGQYLPGGDFGRLPYDDRKRDTVPRSHQVAVGSIVTEIMLYGRSTN